MTISVLGIDLGMSGARAAVVDEAGRLRGRGRAAHPAAGQVDERVERDPTVWIEDVLAASRGALAEAGRPRIEAIGVAALGPCPVLIDAHRQPVGPSPLFSIDSRAQSQRRRLVDRCGLADDAVGQDHVIPWLLWMKENEAARFERAACVVDATGFIVAQLTGRTTMDPITARDHRLPDLDQPVPLPEILPADRFAGGLLPEVAATLGLAAGTPVTVGTYDSYVDVAGAGVATPGEACLLLGTTLIVGRVTADCPAADGLRATPHLGEGWFFGGWTSAAGTVLTWAREVFGADAEAAARDLAPGAGGLVALPYLAGERAPIWDPFARGATLGLTLGTSKAELSRAMLDAVVMSGLDLANRLGEAAGFPERWRASGGGIRHPAWAQAMCDALGRPVEIVAHAGEAVAPALLALRALGHGTGPQIERVLAPDAARHARYARLYPIYRELYPRLADAMHSLGDIAAEKEDS